VCYLVLVLSNRSKLVLGSASPRRRELLERAGYSVDVAPGDVDEEVRAGERAHEYLARIVDAKLAAVRQRAPLNAVLVVADTSVLREDEILGKPRDLDHAATMLRSLAGRTHLVVTRFAVARGERVIASSVSTEVEFRAIGNDEVSAYLATGEGVDKAGGYAIQGVAAMFVRRVVGSYTNVVGLPLCEVVEAVRALDG